MQTIRRVCWFAGLIGILVHSGIAHGHGSELTELSVGGQLDPDTGAPPDQNPGWLPRGWFGWLLSAIVAGIGLVLLGLTFHSWLRSPRPRIRFRVLEPGGRLISREEPLLHRLKFFGSLLCVLIAGGIAFTTVQYLRTDPGESWSWHVIGAVILGVLFVTVLVGGPIWQEQLSAVFSPRRKPLVVALVAGGLSTLAVWWITTEILPQRKHDIATAANSIGDRLLKDGQPHAAIRHLDRALQFQPEYAQAYRTRAQANAAIGNVTKAIDDLSSAIRHAKDPRQDYDCRAELFEQIGNATQALEDRKTLVQFAPNSFYAQIDLARTYTRFGDFRTARDTAVVVEQIVLSERNTEVTEIETLNLAELYLDLDQPREALRLCDRILARTNVTFSVTGFTLRARARLQLGESIAALTDYRRACEARKAFPAPYEQKGYELAFSLPQCEAAWLRATSPDREVHSLLDAQRWLAEADAILGKTPPTLPPEAKADETPQLKHTFQQWWEGKRAECLTTAAALSAAQGNFLQAQKQVSEAKLACRSLRDPYSRRRFDSWWKPRLDAVAHAVEAQRPYREREPAPEPRLAN